MAGFPHLAVVDDEEAIVDILGYTLKKKFPDARITGFHDASEAQAWLARHAVDLLLTDLNMPELNGKEIISMMDRQFPQTPVIVISGAVPLHELKGLEVQFKRVRVFAKPLLTRDLIEGIESGLAMDGALPDQRIQQLSLANLLHLFHLQKKSLQIAVEWNSGNGGVVMQDGQPVLAEFNGDQSEESFYKLLELNDPQVQVEESQFTGEVTLTKDFELLYGEFESRRIDV
ncbi:MAG: response regulator [Verrucomicrobiota bacterium]